MKSVSLALQTLFLLSWMLTVGPASARPPLGGPSPGILALHNGQVITGKILRDGDRYVVTLGESATIRIPVTAVEFHGNNLRHIYRLKEAAVLSNDISGQLRLAQWCIRQGLLAEAERLLERTTPQRNFTQWSDLQRRLTLAQRPTVATSATQAIAAVGKPPPQLEQLLENISTSNLQQFTSFVQPLLLNRCSTATCHGAQSKSSFKLIKPSRGRAIPTRYTQRNLYNTWQTLDPQKPDQSPLINITTAPHGGAIALFTQREWDQYQRLVTWVRRVTQKSSPQIPPGIEQPATVLAQPGPASRGTSADSDKGSEDVNLLQAASVEAVLKAPLLPEGQKKPLLSREAPKRLPATSDPFDPERFNRRFHATRFEQPQQPTAPRRKKPEPATTTTNKDRSTVKER